ncbi:MAG: MtrB/PioB family outer membrane beta-barrel protein [Gemmatimonadetes bacterium]|nr:MtrB/PioB family outer membrane beta-barrel protein [Gemmatimonadota bacterium]
MRNYLASLMLAAVPVISAAQNPAPAAPASGAGQGTVTIGVQATDNNTNSSVFTEYRDLRNAKTPLAFTYQLKGKAGDYLSIAGADVTRRDQSLGLAAGRPGIWRLSATWDELPHELSNKAMSVLSASSKGTLDVPSTMALTFKKLGTGAADAANVVASDAIAAAWVTANARPVDLGTSSTSGAFRLAYSGVKSMNFSFGYNRRAKEGSKVGYGPIGDRPPRTLNIQFAEPVDYTTSDITAAAEIVRPRFQLRTEFLHSQFENAVDVLTWRNVWASAPAGASYDTWDRAVSVYGRRPLAPDNSYQSVTVSGGVALPFASRLTASVALGTMEQDGALLPYAYANDVLVNKVLPRASTQGRMETTALAAEYFIAPLPRLSVRAFARSYELANKTPEDHWQYVTQDTPNLTGTVSYVNKRVNEPLAWDRQNLGVETTVRVPALKGSLVLGYEREDFGREHLEAAATQENIVRLAWNGRPARWLSLRARILAGNRDAGEYDWRAPSNSYWYASSDANDNNNPKFSFENHPDTRAYTMADRARTQADVSVTVTPNDQFSVSARVKTLRDDFDSDVKSVQPLLALTVADREARTPGDQLGLLKRGQQQFSLDLIYAPGDRASLNASFGTDLGTSNMRGLEFNENNKMNPTPLNAATLGPWTRAASQWTADFDDRTAYYLLGGTFELVPNRTTLSANFSSTQATMDLGYAGFGTVDQNGVPMAATHEFGFSSPTPVEQRSQAADLSLQTRLFTHLTARLGLRIEKFTLDDWQQSEGTPQIEAVGTDLLLRDTSRSHQWGNRLINMGSYLAPSYNGTAVYVGLTYGFGGAK